MLEKAHGKLTARGLLRPYRLIPADLHRDCVVENASVVVMILTLQFPYRPEENRELLRSSGFKHVEEFFRWYNFSGMIAVK
jgi:hypothetical protein